MSARILLIDNYDSFTFNLVQGLEEISREEVVVVRNFDRVPQGGVVFSRRNLYRRDNFTCQYCGARPGTQELTLDHVLARSRGGRTTARRRSRSAASPASCATAPTPRCRLL